MERVVQRPNAQAIYEELLVAMSAVLNKYGVHPGDAASMLMNVAIDTLLGIGVTPISVEEGMNAILEKKLLFRMGQAPLGPDDIAIPPMEYKPKG